MNEMAQELLNPTQTLPALMLEQWEKATPLSSPSLLGRNRPASMHRAAAAQLDESATAQYNALLELHDSLADSIQPDLGNLPRFFDKLTELCLCMCFTWHTRSACRTDHLDSRDMFVVPGL
jgi:hypothetical protein